jgi:hypothetical protein
MHIYSRGGGDDFLSSQKNIQATAPIIPPTNPPVLNPFAADSNIFPTDALLTLPVIYRKR